MPALSPRVRHPQSENIPPGQMEPDFPSPSTSRTFPIFSPVQVNGNKNGNLDQGNDDAAELKARRRSRVLEIQRQRLVSSPTAEADRSKSTPLSNLTNAQVAEHYRNCIKLSAENKINAKNAFGLHLIDYMSELIKKKEMNNFQVASSTLDASAKIYAGRVDAIHSDMFKVLGGLGQTSKKRESDDESAGNDEKADGLASPKASPGQEEKKRKKKKPKKIKANIKSITMDSYNLEFEVDPLFKQTSALFDEGGTKGLLINNLSCLDDNCELVFDSKQLVIDFRPKAPRPDPQHVALKGFGSVLRKMKKLEICPGFADFTFTNWSAENEDLFKSLLEPAASVNSKNQHAYNPDLDLEPLADGDAGHVDVEEDYCAEENCGADSDNESTTSERVERHVNLDKEAQLVNTVMESIKQGNLGDLMHVLSVENDYSHFNTSILNTWAGPSLWRMKAGALIKSKLIPTNDADADKNKRKRKAPFKIDLDMLGDFTSLQKESRVATTVKEARMNEYSKSSTTLPADLRVDAEDIFKTGLKDSLLLRRKRSCQDVEDGVGDYDYSNENDANNFCTALNEEDDDDGDLPCTQDSVTHEFQLTNDFDATNRTVFSQESVLNCTTAPESGQMTLLEQPRRINRLEIDYARTAKKIDVKKLKSSMWQLLTNAEKRDEDKTPLAPGELPTSTARMDGQVKFSDLVQHLPEKVPASMAKNLSTPICFVCLLHLVNEKKLSVEGSEDLSDVTISQG